MLCEIRIYIKYLSLGILYIVKYWVECCGFNMWLEILVIE